MTARLDVSVVVPVYNEVDSLAELHRQVTEVLEPAGLAYELLFVDDGSQDGSRDVLRKLAAGDPRVKVALLRRNFGQTAAMQAGFDLARGEVIVPLDADLQNDPADIPILLAKLAEGWDVVSGWRAEREDNWLRRLPSRIANRVLARISGLDLHDSGCTLKAYRRSALAPVRLYGQLHRFIPALCAQYGARVTELPVRHHARVHGRSKYGIGRTSKVIADLILLDFLLHYRHRPIHAFGAWALRSWVLAVALAVVGLARVPAGAAVGWLLAALILAVGGAQLIGLGLLAELLTRTWHEATGRQIYEIEEVLGPAGEL